MRTQVTVTIVHSATGEVLGQFGYPNQRTRYGRLLPSEFILLEQAKNSRGIMKQTKELTDRLVNSIIFQRHEKYYIATEVQAVDDVPPAELSRSDVRS